MSNRHVNKKDLKEICIAATKHFENEGVTVTISKLGPSTTFHLLDFCLVRGSNSKDLELHISAVPGAWMTGEEIYDEIIKAVQQMLDEKI